MNSSERAAAAALAWALAWPAPAAAALGEPLAGVSAEGQRLQAQAMPLAAGGRPAQALHWPDGSWVHQYAGSDGRVQALTWRTRGKPDLRLWLGRYHGAFQQALREQGAHAALPLHAGRWRSGDLVVEAMAHGSVFSGRAYLASTGAAPLPAGDAQR